MPTEGGGSAASVRGVALAESRHHVSTGRTWFGVTKVFIFGDDEVFGEFGPPVASGLDVPALHVSEEVVDSAWFSQLQQTSVQEIPEVPVPSFLSRLPQPRNVVLDAPVLQINADDVLLKLWCGSRFC